ncbi:hypothetical protein LTR37_010049 [Vermiconidia calcicola]|uniref:Uncharacterized protein n=1 Tax=Vermiconidia calcicola TaxID=1690605 RepID=A0ACC3N7A3_9PEZI|nr:hypothetical protein LTR37_010049 [Vermiconidia calcicola]
MATAKKRQAVEDDGGGGGGKQASKCRRLTKEERVLAAIRRPSSLEKDLMMKLPGELRNKIYHLVLPTDRHIYVRAYKCKRYSDEEKISKPQRRWREPGILTTSKQIRREAGSIYYLDNYFTICVRTEEIERACMWHYWTSEMCGWEGNIDFSLYIHSPKWEDMGSWSVLAKVAYESENELYAYTDRHGRTILDRSVVVGGSWSGKKTDALREMAIMGLKARDRGTSYECLEEDFWDWVVSKASALRLGRNDHVLRMLEDDSGRATGSRRRW